MRKKRRLFVVQSKKFIDRFTMILLIFLAFFISFQYVDIGRIFSLISGEAQGFLLTVEMNSIYEGDEVALTLTRSTEDAEIITFTLPEGITLDTSPSERNFSDTTEFAYNKDTNHVKVSYDEGESDREVKIYIFCEEAGIYRISALSTSGVSEELELMVNQVVEDDQVTEVEIGDEDEINDEGTGEEIGDEAQIDDEGTDEEIGDEDQISSEEVLEEDEIKDEETNEIPRSESESGVAYVHNEDEYWAALLDTSIHLIKIEEDFRMSKRGAAQEVWNDLAPRYSRDLVIDGQGHTVDFGGFMICYDPSRTYPMNLTVKNITAYGRNYWGPWRIRTLSGTRGYGTLRFENVHYIGAQLTASYDADIYLAGDIRVEQTTSYVSPFDGKSYSTQAKNQANIESMNLIVEAGTTYYGKTYNSGAWHLKNGGSLTINEDAIIDLYAPGYGNEANGNTIYVRGSLIMKEGSELNIHNDGTGSLARPAIQLSSSSGSIIIGSGAKLNVDIIGNLTTRSAIDMPKNASFIIEDGGYVGMTLRNQGSSTHSAIYGAGSNKLTVGKNATLDVVVDGTGSRSIIKFVGSNNTFQFADTKRINLQLENTNSSSRVIHLASGSLDFDSQSVKAWTSKSWSSDSDDNATYAWSPIYEALAKYSSANVTSVTANSIQPSVTTDFNNNFRTQNFRRVLFENIPDVEIVLGELSDDTTKANSYTISGVTSPGAYVFVSGNNHIPAGTITSPLEDDHKLYHAIADELGKFSITLNEGNYFNAGEIITAYAFLDGKEATATTVVKDEVAPDKPILDPLTYGTIAFTGTAEAYSTVKIHKDGIVVASGFADGNGKYEITIPSEVTLIEGEQYYATATDAAGNESEASDIVTVTIAKPYTEMFVENLNGTDEYRVGNRIQYTILLKNLADDIGAVWHNIDLKDLLPSGLVMDTTTIKKVYYTYYGEVFEYSLNADEVWDPITNLLRINQSNIYGTEELKITFEAIIGEELADSMVVNTVTVISDYFEEISDEVAFTVMELGGLEFVSTPKTINFGHDLKVSSKEKSYQLESKDEELIVRDSRGKGNTWSITAKLLTELTSESGHELLGSLYYINDGQEFAFSKDSSVPIYSTVTQDSDSIVISDTWGNSTDELVGPVLRVRPGQALSELYHAEIQWILRDVPGN